MSINVSIKSAKDLKITLKTNFPKIYEYIESSTGVLNFCLGDPPRNLKNVIQIPYECASLLAGFTLIDNKKIILYCRNLVDIPNSKSLIVMRLTRN